MRSLVHMETRSAGDTFPVTIAVQKDGAYTLETATVTVFLTNHRGDVYTDHLSIANVNYAADAVEMRAYTMGCPAGVYTGGINLAWPDGTNMTTGHFRFTLAQTRG